MKIKNIEEINSEIEFIETHILNRSNNNYIIGYYNKKLKLLYQLLDNMENPSDFEEVELSFKSDIKKGK